MRSMWQILNSVIDGEINTPEQGEALITEEAQEYARVLQITEEAARAQLLQNLNHRVSLCLQPDAAKFRDVFHG